MDLLKYQEQMALFKSPSFYQPVNSGTTSDNIPIDILHAIIGAASEGGEMLDVAKASLFYGRKIDYTNLDEEFGDLLWYVALYATTRSITIADLAKMNTAKLRKRFPEKFTEELANNRNLAAEREVLEQHSPGAPNGQSQTKTEV